MTEGSDPERGPDRSDGSPDETGPTEGEQWRYSVEDVEEEADPLREPIEPGTPAAENVVFVLLGIVFGVTILLVTFGVIP